ncbi:MAG: serpin family protein [Lawsonibacter sp.]|nr:serpin family protein [Lawsonibacter sp.]
MTSWVKEQTNGLIGGEAPVVQTRPSTLALLVSSLYYRAGWMDEFMAELTSEDTFTGAAGQEQRTDFMHMTQQSSFLRREGWQSAYLTTQLGEMIFVLPDEGVTPESLLQSGDLLTSLDFTAENGAIAGEVQWSVPKFDVDSSLDLKSALAALGITDLLEPDSADLTPLTDLDAYLSEARQLARVKVDEEGVEAAAATILMLNESSIMPPEHPEICVMDLDRPFLFVIRHEGIPLFVGIVNQM